MLVDAHMHITKNDIQNGILDILEQGRITSFVSAGDAEECLFLQELAVRSPLIIPTYGIHPWKANGVEAMFMAPFLEECAIIGEIGMDSVWCDVSLSVQREVFLSQMELAEERGCPVILHTKGQEKEIAQIIADYTMPIIVHWYSCNEHLDAYLERDCYFTVGPDVWTNQAVQQVAKRVPLSRLFVETDGVEASSWAMKKEVHPRDLPRILCHSIEYIAKEKSMPIKHVEKIMEGNIRTFCAWGDTMHRIRA